MKDDIFNEKNIPQAGWFKFQKVGDRVSGEVVEKWEQPSKGDGFPAQRCFALKQSDGSIINVGLKQTSQYLMQRTMNVEPGDRLGVEFKAEVPSAKFKGKMAKSIEVYVSKAEPKDGFEESGF